MNEAKQERRSIELFNSVREMLKTKFGQGTSESAVERRKMRLRTTYHGGVCNQIVTMSGKRQYAANATGTLVRLDLPAPSADLTRQQRKQAAKERAHSGEVR